MPAAVGMRPGILVLHGARYSPHDNPLERVWAALKAWLANTPTLTIQGRVHQAHAFRRRTDAQNLTTAASHSSPWLPEGYIQHFRAAQGGSGRIRADQMIPRYRCPRASPPEA
jgi:hypothetical protein